MPKILSNPLLYVAVLTGAVLICYGRTLGSYFLADDFGEVAYVSKIFEGDLPRLWSNFTGNYMQVPSMAVYRPWLLLTLFFDYAIWRTNAFGYYCTNLLHYLACTLLIFALIKLLTPYWGKLRSNLAATFAGLVFATNPLHCESVSWVVGRVDIVSCTYYLLGLVSVALYVRSSNKKWLILTFASFWLGILTKEMAIALPVTATLLAFLWGKARGFHNRNSQQAEPPKTASQKTGSNDLNFDPSALANGQTQNPQVVPTEPSRASAIAALQKLDQELEPHSAAPPAVPQGDLVQTGETPTSPINQISWRQDLQQRIHIALPVGAMLFACTIVYFIIRYACLHTITGGYTGSIGSSQLSGILEKWTDLDTVMRIVYPLNQFVFGESTAQKNLLSGIYLLLIALVTTRLVIGSWPRRWLIFIFVSMLTALAPIYQLWGIGYDLEGSRFVFFLTVPLAMLFPIILFSPLKKTSPTSLAQESDLNRTPPAETATHEDVSVVGISKLTDSESGRKTSLRLMVLSIIALMSLTFVYAKLLLHNNIPWIHAGKQTESIHEKAIALSKATPAGKLVGVVGIPKDQGGAHMILNGSTFRHLITPPFADAGLTGKILTFEPVLFGDPQKVDTGHFKEALAKGNIESFLVWNMEKRDFVKFNPGTPPVVPQIISIPLIGPGLENKIGAGRVPESSSSVSGSKTSSQNKTAIAAYPYTQGRGDVNPSGLIENANRGLGLRISGLSVHPAQFDYLVVRAHAPVGTVSDPAAGKIFGTDSCKVQLESNAGKTGFDVRFDVETKPSNGNSQIEIRLPLSSYWHFYSGGEINTMVVDLPSVSSLAIDAVELVPAALLAPSVTVLDRSSADDGAFNVDRRNGRTPAPGTGPANSAHVRIAVDTTRLKNASSIEMQILKQNFFFDNIKTEAALKNGTLTVLRSTGNKSIFDIPESNTSGYFQLRVRSLDTKNQQVGAYSFPITLRVMTNQLQ